jgi:hypothetical protein
MRTTMRYLTPLIAAPGAAAAILAAPTAAADDSNLPSCTNVGGDELNGTATTECATPGNVQLNAAPPVEQPTYPYPWDDEFYGPALIIGDGGDHGGGGGGHR